VKAAVLATAAGTLQGGSGSIGTLANNGVQLAPYHDFDSKVPADLKSEVDKLKADIISGAVKVSSPAQPQPPAPAGAGSASVAPSASGTAATPSPTAS